MQIFKISHARARRKHLHRLLGVLDTYKVKKKKLRGKPRRVPAACTRQFTTAEDSSQEAVEAAFPCTTKQLRVEPVFTVI